MKRSAFTLIVLAVALFLIACQPGPKPEPIPELIGGENATPAAEDFNISGLSQIYDGSPKTVKITPKPGKSSGTITIYYKGARAAPSAVGSYAVTFDVAAATGWNAATSLNAGTLAIRQTVSQGKLEYYWINEHGSLVTTSGGAITITAGETLTITAQGMGYDVKQWHLNGINTGQSGNTYNFSRTTAGEHTVGLFVEKDGKLYNTNITITVTIQEPVENAYGRISISFEGEDAAPRTVLPLTVFDKYVYTFTKAGETTGMVKTPDNDGYFTLEVGSYTVAVQAYIGTAGSYALAASGVSPQFSIRSGSNAPVRVPLSGVDTAAQGKFTYTITYPAGSAVEITLQRWPELVNNTLNPVNITQGNGKTQTLELGTGAYLLTVLINKNELYAGTSEAVHIYPLLTTVYAKNFVDNDFLSLPIIPAAYPPAGSYATAQNVTLSTATPGAVIRYTLNGDAPTESSAQYDGPIAISHSTALKAIAIIDGLSSEILTAAYNISRAYTESVQRVTFTGSAATVNFDYLNGNDIYLVKVNTSGSIVSAANTGGVSGSSPSLLPGIHSDELLYASQNELPRMGHPAADELNANPPPIPDAEPRGSRAVFIPPVVGDTRMFWVETYYHNDKWVKKQATLRAAGQYSNIWVMDENYGSGGGNKVTTAQAQTLAAKFDLIYPIETNLLGYEYGGGPGGDGGRDSDPKIQILIYSIVDASGVVQAGGFFWSKDFYPQIINDLLGYKTNQAEIFYVDASQVNNSPDYTYSVLIHEFQHMINFNVKTVKQIMNSETWYNEMLSMMAEDVIAPLIGVVPANSRHITNQRIPTFLNNYHKTGITEWGTLERESYAKGYAFGAYLLRNYGGASLLREMLANNSTNIASVTAALRTVNTNSGLSFEEALRRYGEAMVFSGTIPADVQSFDKTVEKTIGGYTYTATKFNIWGDFGSTKPKIFGINEQMEMRPYSITVHQAASGWTGQSGTKTITLQKPNNTNVEFYLMVK